MSENIDAPIDPMQAAKDSRQRRLYDIAIAAMLVALACMAWLLA